MENHFAWWYLSNRPLDVYRLTEDLIATSLHYSPKRRERFLHGRALLAELMFQLYGYEKLPRLAIALVVGPVLLILRCQILASDMPVVSLRSCSAPMEKLAWTLKLFAHVRVVLFTFNSSILPAAKNLIDGQADRLEATTQLWAIRESVLKISGLGTSGLQTLRLQPNAGKLRSTATPQVETISAIQGEIAWACSKSPTLGQLNYWLMDKNNQLINITAEKNTELKESTTYLRFTSHSPIQTL